MQSPFRHFNSSPEVIRLVGFEGCTPFKSSAQSTLASTTISTSNVISSAAISTKNDVPDHQTANKILTGLTASRPTLTQAINPGASRPQGLCTAG